MKKLNNRIYILIGLGMAVSGVAIAALLKMRTKKLSNLGEDYFDNIEKNSCVNDKFYAENLNDDIEKEEIYSLADEYVEYESKEEELKDLSVQVMDVILKELISMSENLNEIKKDTYGINKAKDLVQELENCKEEIISLWEHLEGLSKIKEEIDRG